MLHGVRDGAGAAAAEAARAYRGGGSESVCGAGDALLCVQFESLSAQMPEAGRAKLGLEGLRASIVPATAAATRHRRRLLSLRFSSALAESTSAQPLHAGRGMRRAAASEGTTAAPLPCALLAVLPVVNVLARFSFVCLRPRDHHTQLHAPPSFLQEEDEDAAAAITEGEGREVYAPVPPEHGRALLNAPTGGRGGGRVLRDSYGLFRSHGIVLELEIDLPAAAEERGDAVSLTRPRIALRPRNIRWLQRLSRSLKVRSGAARAADLELASAVASSAAFEKARPFAKPCQPAALLASLQLRVGLPAGASVLCFAERAEASPATVATAKNAAAPEGEVAAAAAALFPSTSFLRPQPHSRAILLRIAQAALSLQLRQSNVPSCAEDVLRVLAWHERRECEALFPWAPSQSTRVDTRVLIAGARCMAKTATRDEAELACTRAESPELLRRWEAKRCSFVSSSASLFLIRLAPRERRLRQVRKMLSLVAPVDTAAAVAYPASVAAAFDTAEAFPYLPPRFADLPLLLLPRATLHIHVSDGSAGVVGGGGGGDGDGGDGKAGGGRLRDDENGEGGRAQAHAVAKLRDAGWRWCINTVAKRWSPREMMAAISAKAEASAQEGNCEEEEGEMRRPAVRARRTATVTTQARGRQRQRRQQEQQQGTVASGDSLLDLTFAELHSRFLPFEECLKDDGGGALPDLGGALAGDAAVAVVEAAPPTAVQAATAVRGRRLATIGSSDESGRGRSGPSAATSDGGASSASSGSSSSKDSAAEVTAGEVSGLDCPLERFSAVLRGGDDGSNVDSSAARQGAPPPSLRHVVVELHGCKVIYSVKARDHAAGIARALRAEWALADAAGADADAVVANRKAVMVAIHDAVAGIALVHEGAEMDAVGGVVEGAEEQNIRRAARANTSDDEEQEEKEKEEKEQRQNPHMLDLLSEDAGRVVRTDSFGSAAEVAGLRPSSSSTPVPRRRKTMNGGDDDADALPLQWLGALTEGRRGRKKKTRGTD